MPDEDPSDMNAVLVQRAAGMCLKAETTAIENVAVRRTCRAYRKKHPEWRQEWDRLLREQYAVERRAAMKVVT